MSFSSSSECFVRDDPLNEVDEAFKEAPRKSIASSSSALVFVVVPERISSPNMLEVAPSRTGE
jgi:hypothetical protein